MSAPAPESLPPSASSPSLGVAWLDALRGAASGTRFVRAWLVVLWSCAGAWALSSLWLPYAWDQGCFGYLSNTIVHGGMPYRDAWDFKGPLTFYVFAALQFVFGRQMWAIRAFDLAMLAWGCVAGTRLVSRFVSRQAAVCTMLMVVLTYASFGSWYTAQPDAWSALALIVVACLLVPQEAAPTGAREAALAAMLLGACSLFKPLYALFLLLVLCALWPVSAAGRGRALRSAGIATAAFALPLLVAVVWFAAHGALSDLIDGYLRFNRERLAGDPQKMGVARIVQVTLGIPTSVPILALALPATALGAGFVTRERPRAGILLVLWVVLSLVTIAAQRKFLKQNYSWHPLFPPVGILAGIGLTRLWNARGPEVWAGRWLVVATAAALFKLASREPLTQVARWARHVVGRTSTDQFLDELDVNPYYGPASNFGFSVSRDFKIADYLRAHTGPSDEVLVWSDPLVNYLSDRPALTPITGSSPFNKRGFGSDARRMRYRTELLSHMSSPAAAYFGAADKDLIASSDDEQNLASFFPEVQRLLDTEYEPAERIGDVQLFKRRGR